MDIKYANLPKAVRIRPPALHKNFAVIRDTNDVLDYDKYMNEEILVVGKIKNLDGKNKLELYNDSVKRDRETFRLIKDLKIIPKKERDLKRVKKKLEKIYKKKHTDFIKEEEKEFAPDGPGYLRALTRFTQRNKSKSRAKSLPLLSIKEVINNTYPKSAPAIILKKTPKSKSKRSKSKKSKSKRSKSKKFKSKKYKLKIVDKLSPRSKSPRTKSPRTKS
jgi:hypothetical protein